VPDDDFDEFWFFEDRFSFELLVLLFTGDGFLAPSEFLLARLDEFCDRVEDWSLASSLDAFEAEDITDLESEDLTDREEEAEDLTDLPPISLSFRFITGS
jgi:hypothetical protein